MLAFAYGIGRLRGGGGGMRSSARPMLLAALLFSLNAYMNIKIAIFAALLGGAYLFIQTVLDGLWRRRCYWQNFC